MTPGAPMIAGAMRTSPLVAATDGLAIAASSA
jgi:hypothetical protein